MLKYTFVAVVLLAACGGKSKPSGTPTPSAGGCDPVGTWELKFAWEGAAPAACGTDVPWDQPFTVIVTKPSVPTVEEDAQKTPWGNSTVKAAQMLGELSECTIGFVGGGAAGGRGINLNIGPLHQTGNTASGEVELNRPAVTDGGEGCSRKGKTTATRK